jgi:hypothetical protein
MWSHGVLSLVWLAKNLDMSNPWYALVDLFQNMKSETRWCALAWGVENCQRHVRWCALFGASKDCSSNDAWFALCWPSRIQFLPDVWSVRPGRSKYTASKIMLCPSRSSKTTLTLGSWSALSCSFRPKTGMHSSMCRSFSPPRNPIFRG